jgi:hypothetical protein
MPSAESLRRYYYHLGIGESIIAIITDVTRIVNWAEVAKDKVHFVVSCAGLIAGMLRLH